MRLALLTSIATAVAAPLPAGQYSFMSTVGSNLALRHCDYQFYATPLEVRGSARVAAQDETPHTHKVYISRWTFGARPSRCDHKEHPKGNNRNNPRRPLRFAPRFTSVSRRWRRIVEAFTTVAINTTRGTHDPAMKTISQTVVQCDALTLDKSHTSTPCTCATLLQGGNADFQFDVVPALNGQTGQFSLQASLDAGDSIKHSHAGLLQLVAKVAVPSRHNHPVSQSVSHSGRTLPLSLCSP